MSWTWRKPRRSVEPELTRPWPREPEQSVEIAKLRGQLAAAQLEILRLSDQLATAETLKEQAEQVLGAERARRRSGRSPFGMAVDGRTDPAQVVWFPDAGPRPQRIEVPGGDV